MHIYACCRDGKPYWWGIIGGILLAGYGVVATAQPSGLDFGRIYAAYGCPIPCFSAPFPPLPSATRARLFAHFLPALYFLFADGDAR